MSQFVKLILLLLLTHCLPPALLEPASAQEPAVTEEDSGQEADHVTGDREELDDIAIEIRGKRKRRENACRSDLDFWTSVSVCSQNGKSSIKN